MQYIRLEVGVFSAPNRIDEVREVALVTLEPFYFFLVLVGDYQGLSYYSLRSISSYLKLSQDEIKLARASLCNRSLIAYKEPLYQVLSILQKPEIAPRASSLVPRGGDHSIGEILKELLKENPHA